MQTAGDADRHAEEQGRQYRGRQETPQQVPEEAEDGSQQQPDQRKPVDTAAEIIFIEAAPPAGDRNASQKGQGT